MIRAVRTKQATEIGRAIGRRMAWEAAEERCTPNWQGLQLSQCYELGTHDIHPWTPLWCVAERAAKRAFITYLTHKKLQRKG